MRERPILFNTEMVKAILDGRKTCTRRIVNGYIPKDAEFGYTAFTPKGAISCRGTFETDHLEYGEKFFKLPYHKGDILYVRETWSEWIDGYLYKAWTELFPQPGQFPGIKWKPSIHMPKEAARIWLKVTDVRVERLQEITEDQTEEEGFLFTPPCLHLTGENYCDIDGPCTSKVKYCDMGAGELFGKVLWNSTIKKTDLDRYRWDANPWVWVIEFERCKSRERSSNGY